MDLDTFRWLLSADGQVLLVQAMASDLSDAARLSTLTQLRRHATPTQAAAVYETAWLRKRAAEKFARAGHMYFTREALEQASGEIVGAYRAGRFAEFEAVGDLCCSIGGDAIAMAQSSQVQAVDIDPLRLAMAAENAQACGVGGRIRWIEADLTQFPLPDAQAAFFDPARRAGSRRVTRLADYAPPATLVHTWRKSLRRLGVKVAPGVTDAELETLRPTQVEFISVDGEMKEATLWFGPAAIAGPPERRATLLRAGAAPMLLSASNDVASTPLSRPLAFLYEPDPAILRARLVGQVAAVLNAAQLDEQIAYLTASQFTATPLARGWRVLDWLPFNLKPLRARLREMDAGPVTVKKRGSPVDTDALARQLSGAGSRALVVVLTQVEGRPAALICEGPLSQVDSTSQVEST